MERQVVGAIDARELDRGELDAVCALRIFSKFVTQQGRLAAEAGNEDAIAASQSGSQAHGGGAAVHVRVTRGNARALRAVLLPVDPAMARNIRH